VPRAARTPTTAFALVVALAVVVVAALVVPWGRLQDAGAPSDDGREGQVVVRDTDNPAPRTKEAEQLEASQRGEREFVRDLKDAARAERTDRIRRQRDTD